VTDLQCLSGSTCRGADRERWRGAGLIGGMGLNPPKDAIQTPV
jgi:hypothetical protein